MRLFRVFRTAIDLRMLLLGSMAVVLLACGDAVLSHLPFAPAAGNLESPLGWDNRLQTPSPLALPDLALRYPWHPAVAAAANGEMVLRPARTVFGPIQTILRADASWGQKTFAFTRLLWAMCVWALVAGAMCRVAAVEQGGETKISLVSAPPFFAQEFSVLHHGVAASRHGDRALFGFSASWAVFSGGSPTSAPPSWAFCGDWSFSSDLSWP